MRGAVHNPRPPISTTEVEVFNGTSPANAWVDLDLSGTIGAVSAIVILKFFNAAVLRIGLRRNGDTDEFDASTNQARGAASGEVVAGDHVVLVGVTDSNGVVEWFAHAAKSGTTIDLLGYIK